MSALRAPLVRDWGQALSITRVERNLSRRELADRVGVSVSTLTAWEDGTAIPAGSQLPRLYASLPRMREHQSLIRDIKQAVAQEPAKPAPAAPTPLTFGQALEQEMRKANTVPAEVAKLLGVTSTAVSHYLAGRAKPSHESHEALVTLFPALASIPFKASVAKPMRLHVLKQPPTPPAKPAPPPAPEPKLKIEFRYSPEDIETAANTYSAAFAASKVAADDVAAAVKELNEAKERQRAAGAKLEAAHRALSLLVGK